MMNNEYHDNIPAQCARIVVDVMEASESRSSMDVAELHGRICAGFDAVIKSCGNALDLLYPVGALADEVMVNLPEYRQYWSENLIQLRYFGETSSGTGFFTRLDELMAGEGGAYLLELYFICLTMGFKGRYGVGNSRRLRDITADLAAHLSAVRRGKASCELLTEECGVILKLINMPRYLLYLCAVSALALTAAAAALAFASGGFIHFLDTFL